MKCNVGKTDKMLRIIAGAVIICAGVVFNNWLGLIGIIPLVTGIFSFCPAYRIFSISTAKK